MIKLAITAVCATVLIAGVWNLGLAGARDDGDSMQSTKDWGDGRNQTVCDINPSCNGWNWAMVGYSASRRGVPVLIAHAPRYAASPPPVPQRRYYYAPPPAPPPTYAPPAQTLYAQVGRARPVRVHVRAARVPPPELQVMSPGDFLLFLRDPRRPNRGEPY